MYRCLLLVMSLHTLMKQCYKLTILTEITNSLKLENKSSVMVLISKEIYLAKVNNKHFSTEELQWLEPSLLVTLTD